MIKLFKNEKCSVSFDMETMEVRSLLDEPGKVTKCVSKSDMFRKLYDFGMEINEIALNCESHYSFVYGVISSSRETRKVEKSSKSDEIRKLFSEGKTVGDIAKLLNSNYSFCFSVVKKYKESLAKETAV
jgi:DUF438 domain-containing protein